MAVLDWENQGLDAKGTHETNYVINRQLWSRKMESLFNTHWSPRSRGDPSLVRPPWLIQGHIPVCCIATTTFVNVVIRFHVVSDVLSPPLRGETFAILTLFRDNSSTPLEISRGPLNSKPCRDYLAVGRSLRSPFPIFKELEHAAGPHRIVIGYYQAISPFE